MHEQTKLEEADFFLQGTEDGLAALTDRSSDSPTLDKVFKYNLSAFLSAARSVAQYARKEASAKNKREVWYDPFVAEHQLIRFFTEERNTNIHERPVEPSGVVDIYTTDALHMTEWATVEKFDQDGNLVEVTPCPPEAPNRSGSESVSFDFRYRFAAWTGPEEVVPLCGAYLEALREMVEDGRQRGILS